MTREIASVSAKRRGRSWQTLARRKDFLRIAASGLKRVTPAFVLQAAGRIFDESALHIGFTASRKVGNAVARSRAKRRLRALADAVMGNDQTMPALDRSFDYVLIGRPEILRRDFAVMTEDLRQALRKLAGKKTAGHRAADPSRTSSMAAS